MTIFNLKQATLAALIVAAGALPATAQTAKATLKTADGKDAGTATLTQTPSGVLIALSAKNLPAGEHAFHVHAVGKCEPPFTSAGGHFNPESKKHGLMASDGHHAGDMPNLHVGAGGDIAVEVINASITLDKGKPNSAFGPNGTALVVHAGKDDYKTDPTGDAGGRIACGVIE
ncbi:MAG: superoxide dismutase family protein [Pseudolabrys sp.]